MKEKIIFETSITKKGEGKNVEYIPSVSFKTNEFEEFVFIITHLKNVLDSAEADVTSEVNALLYGNEDDENEE